MSPEEQAQTALPELIGLIYEAAFDSSQWQAVLQRFSHLVHASAAAGFLHNFDAATQGGPALGGSFAVMQGMSESAMADYATHFGAINPWAANEEVLRPGVAVSSSMLYPDHLLPKTEFYGDFLRHQGVFYSLGGVTDRAASLALKFSFMRPRAHGHYQAHELAMWQALVPHVQRAARLHLRLQQLAAQAVDTEEALAALAGGLIVLNHEGRVQRINPQAQALLAAPQGLTVSGAGWVHITPASAEAGLQRAVRAALLPQHALQAPREVLHCHGTGGCLRLEVVPLPNAGRQPDQQRCALLVSRPAPAAASLAAALQRVYHMTPSEAALTAALVDGQSLAQVAEQRAVSIHTVRTQLKSATAKAGAKRQADLVRIVLTGPALRMPDGPAPD